MCQLVAGEGCLGLQLQPGGGGGGEQLGGALAD